MFSKEMIEKIKATYYDFEVVVEEDCVRIADVILVDSKDLIDKYKDDTHTVVVIAKKEELV